jgi:hypothetical protein
MLKAEVWISRGRLTMTYRRCFATTRIALMLSALVWLSGCGGGNEGDGPAEETEATSVSTTADPSDKDVATTQVDRCPLTAEQVSQVLGQPVEIDEPSCSFFPPTDGMPNASFNLQVAWACTEDMLAEGGYEVSVSGIGDAAYVQPGMADGTWLLVCAGDAPFEIRVDGGNGDNAAQAAAEELARIVLAGR